MCNIPVNLPTLSSFLMLYSLRCGCIIVWVWTLVRSLFYVVFFLYIVIRMYMPDQKPKDAESRPPEKQFFPVFVGIIVMIVVECFVVMYSVYLAVGLYYDSAYRIEQYLIGRFCTLLVEICGLVTLLFNHQYFMGWYLVFLMVIILEFYSFIVVYSYYVDIIEEQKGKCIREICESNFGNCLMPQPQVCFSSRAMRFVRDKLYKKDLTDYGQRCARSQQDPNICSMCMDYKTPPY